MEKSGGTVRNTRDTSSENAVKTLQWLLKSVSNLKADVNQINQGLNVSKTLQHAEEVQKQIHLIQVLISGVEKKNTRSKLKAFLSHREK